MLVTHCHTACAMAEPVWRDLETWKRRRLIAATLLRALVSSGGAGDALLVLPMNQTLDSSAVLRLVVRLIIFAG